MRVGCYIDGHNLHRAIDELGQHHLKWVNLHALAAYFAGPDSQVITVKIFTAVPWSLEGQDAEEKEDQQVADRRRSVEIAAEPNETKLERHRRFAGTQIAAGCEIVDGRFKPRPRHCPECHHKWHVPREKETDVNIAVHVIADIHRLELDCVMIISADSDLVPVLEMAQQITGVSTLALLPPVSHKRAIKHGGPLKDVSEYRQIKLAHLRHNLMAEIAFGYRRPLKYDPPGGRH